MSEWKKVRLGEIGRVVGGATPSTKNPAYYDGDISWITPKDLAVHKAVWIRNGERSISEEGLKSCSAQLLPKGTILFSSRAPIGYVALAACELCTNQGFKSLIPNESLDSLFGYYLLVYNREQIENLGSGTTFKEVSGSTMRDVEISLPPLPIQRKIAAVLGALDDKIENNRKICANLEAQAQAIFKSWFVDFEPFGGKMPQEWKMGKLGDVFIFRRGATVSKKDVKQIRDIDHKYVVYGAGQDVFGYSKNFILNQPSVLIAAIGAGAGFVSRSFEKKYSVTSNAFYVTPMDEFAFPYAFYFLKQWDFLTFCSGSAQPMLAYNAFANEIIPVPDYDSLEKFCNICWPLIREIDSMCSESRALAAMRDALLPKLMSGEIDVENVEVA